MLSDCGTVQTNPQGRELLEHGDYQLPVACYLCDMQHFTVPWHWHNEFEAGYIEKGTIIADIGSSRYLIHEGEGFFINSNTLHAMRNHSDAPCIVYNIVFHPRFIGGSMDSIFWSKYILPVSTNKYLPGFPLTPAIQWQSEILENICSAWHAFAEENPIYEITARNSLSLLIATLREQQTVPKEKTTDKMIRDSERIKIMLDFIHQNYLAQLSVSQIASHASISESECMRCFHSTIHTTPIAYLKTYRLQQAAQMLTSTNEAVNIIGEKCGFMEMSYFAKSFRKVYGMTPSEYRKTVG